MFKKISILFFSGLFFLFSCSEGKSTDLNDSGNYDSENDGTIIETDISDEENESVKTDETESENEMDEVDSEENDFSIKEDEDVESPDENECQKCVITEAVRCLPSADACAEHESDPKLYASYRKDFYYPNYQEGDVTNPIPAPVNGGRFNTTGIALKGGEVTAVLINGVNVNDLLT